MGQEIKFVQGNEACVEAALYAGLNFFAGYPITPSTEIAEHLSQRLPQIGGKFLQSIDGFLLAKERSAVRAIGLDASALCAECTICLDGHVVVVSFAPALPMSLKPSAAMAQRVNYLGPPGEEK